MNSAAVIIPFRDRGGDPARAANLQRVLEHWRAAGIEPLVVDDGRSGDALFNRSAAYNRAAAQTNADILIYSEADVLVDTSQVGEAVQLAAQRPGLVVPYYFRANLSPEDSELVRTHRRQPHECSAESLEDTAGCVNVLSRATLATVGGWDEGFEGHGYDDYAMKVAFERIGLVGRLSGYTYHLHHDIAATAADVAATQRNERRYKDRYLSGRPPALDSLQKSVVAFPLYHQVPAAWFSQWLRLDHTHVAATVTVNGAYITTAMATIVDNALSIAAEWDRLLVYEHDMIPPPDAITRMAHYSPDHDIVGTMYFQHDPPHGAMVYVEHPDGSTDPISPQTVKEWTDNPALYRCGAVGFGFTSIHRRVLEQWDKTVPMFGLGEGYGSHDLLFCRKARAQGFAVYVDSGICCHHLSQVAVGLHHNQECAPMIDDAPRVDFAYEGT